MENYKMKPNEAQEFSDFLLPMLAWEPDKRATAKEMLSHPWLHIPSENDSEQKKEGEDLGLVEGGGEGDDDFETESEESLS